MPTTKQPYTADDSMGYYIHRLSKVWQRHFEVLLEESGSEITIQMWVILSAIGNHNITIPSQIAEKTGIDRTATARSLTKMSKLKLTSRKPSQNDGRSSQIHLTKKGEHALGVAAYCSQKTNEYFLDKLSSREHEALKKIINKLLSGEKGDISYN
ncbi:winged helix-turn-helix transcriptional regulator [Endozoicomonas sp. SM1973]|uniref:Winged helix-turn-helix transcriptional regulator n=1 Tax=Spartinivicinus marinus TaxID=2994442 RepID=A0A853IEY1_9GAMM|nr:MarR family winged helix-turn-helix transcriptional regulator [Spartinivicinus marinus]MCX4025314.1 MarR family winged helix-turn-helix transcriptional regulator [Spartinivicinus marinus]NYZ66036.1 winged helix-turn-helix transcriptional regulator [Spartinivicinus marinus]